MHALNLCKLINIWNHNKLEFFLILQYKKNKVYHISNIQKKVKLNYYECNQFQFIVIVWLNSHSILFFAYALFIILIRLIKLRHVFLIFQQINFNL